MKLVLDASVVLRILLYEKGAEKYAKYFHPGEIPFVITNLTLYEIKAVMMRLERPRDEIVAALAYSKSYSITSDITEAIALRAADLKAKYAEHDKTASEKANVSLADAIMLALAEEKNLPVLTADKRLRQVTEVKIVTE